MYFDYLYEFGIGDDGLPNIFVTETKCITTSLFWKENICPEPKPNLIVMFEDRRSFFVAFSSKDDGTIVENSVAFTRATLAITKEPKLEGK